MERTNDQTGHGMPQGGVGRGGGPPPPPKSVRVHVLPRCIGALQTLLYFLFLMSPLGG